MITKNIKEFKGRWREKAEEIKKQKFDENQVAHIKEDFITECESFLNKNYQYEYDFIHHREEIKNDLYLALEIALSNYRQEKKGFWSRIFGGKKELNLVKLK